MSIALQAFWRLIRHDTTRYDTILVDCDDLQCSAGCCATCPLLQWQSDMISDMSLFFFAFFIFLHSWDDTQKMPSWVLHDFDPVASLRRRIHFFIRQCCQACKKFALSLFWQLFQVVLLAIPRKKGVDWLWRVFQNWSHSWFCDYFCDCAGLGDIPQQIDQSSSDLAKGGWRSGEELHTERGPEKLTGHCEGWYWSILDIVKDRPLWRWYQSKVYWLWLIDQWVQWSQSISAACYELFI